MEKLLSVVIPNFNDKDNLKVCLKSLEENLQGMDYEVIVVDNGSSDGSAGMIKRDFPWVRLIENPENRYFAAANNQGFKLSNGKYITILNSDTEIISDIIFKMVDYMENPENINVGACNCNIYYPDGRRQETNLRFTNLSRFIIRFILLEKNILKKILPGFYQWLKKTIYYPSEYVQPMECDMLMGCMILARRIIINELKGFDERFRLYFTDDELCYRIRQAGYNLVSLPYDKIIHHHFAATSKVFMVNRILDEDAVTYLKVVVGKIPGYIGVFLYKIDRLIVRTLLKLKFTNQTKR